MTLSHTGSIHISPRQDLLDLHFLQNVPFPVTAVWLLQSLLPFPWEGRCLEGREEELSMLARHPCIVTANGEELSMVFLWERRRAQVSRHSWESFGHLAVSPHLSSDLLVAYIMKKWVSVHGNSDVEQRKASVEKEIWEEKYYVLTDFVSLSCCW